MITKQEVNKRINEIGEIADERNEKTYAWFRAIITISVGLVGILISFKSDETTSSLKSLFFVVTISSLGLGILFSLIFLLAEVNVLNRTLKNRTKHLFSRLDGKDELEIEKILPASFYKISYSLSFVFYIIALFSLIGYGIVDEIKNICQQWL